ncbi:MAG: hypothetical protein J6Y74_02425 [Clostridia bacterium]|nr:hypothetical protein [Clostridia bacterium]
MKKIGLWVLAFLLIVGLALGFVACKKKETPTDPPAVSEIKITFDDTAEYHVEDVADNADILNVEVVTDDGAARKVEYRIVSTKISEDGKYIEVVISVDGAERTVRLPYAGEKRQEEEKQSSVRAELQPLYELLKKEGKKSFRVTLAGDYSDGEAEPQSFGVRMVLNEEDTGASFALLTANEEGVILSYDHSVLSLGGISLDNEKMQDVFLTLLGGIDLDMDALADIMSDEAGKAKDEKASEDADTEETDALTSLFIEISSALDLLDGLSDRSLVALLGVTVEKTENTYTVSANSKRWITFLKTFLPENVLEDIDFDTIVDLIDAQTGGALKAGDIAIKVISTIKDNGMDLSLNVENKKTDEESTFAFSLEVSESAFSIPSADPAETIGSDVEINIPIALPKNDFSLNLTLVLHTSNALSYEGKDLLTGSLDYKDIRDAVRFVLNEGYLYVDARTLATSMSMDPANATFYKAFEVEGKPASFFEALPGLIFGLIAKDKDADDQTAPKGEDPQVEAEEGLFKNGYGARADTDDGVAALPIGATEEDLRKAIEVYYFDERDEQIEYDDYTVDGFDSSVSFIGEVTIILAPGYDTNIPVRIYDPKNEKKHALVWQDNRFALGTTREEAQASFAYILRYTDGTIFWDVYKEGVTFTNIYPLLTENVFATAGDYMLSVSNEDGLTALGTIHIYDPEHLLPEKIEAPETVYLVKGATEEALREELYVSIMYDDASNQDVEDYTIEGYSEDADSIVVKWGTLEETVEIEYYEPTEDITEEPTEDEASASIFRYFRFLEGQEVEEPSAEELQVIETVILSIIKENKELLDSICTFSKTAKSATLHVALNDASDKDLLALLNSFLGVPTEDGWADIDAAHLAEIINALNKGDGMMIDFSLLFESLVGVSLEDALEDLACEVTLSWEEGISISVSLEDSESESYCSVGVGVRSVPAAETAFIAESEIVKDRDFETIPALLIGVLMHEYFA